MPAIVLLSAGLDSTINFKHAFDECGVAAALTANYGQRAAAREIRAARAICRRFHVRHEVVALPWLRRITRTALVARARPLPHPDAADLDRPLAAARSADRVWVPNRNGLFLAVAAAFAESLTADTVVTGFNAEEAATFPDNSAEFIRATNHALRFSTRGAVKAICYTQQMRKSQIVRLGLRINAPMDLAWCCYEGGPRLCGRCESCRRFVRAIRHARAEDWFAERHRWMPEVEP